MTAHQSVGTPPEARADRAPTLHRGRRRPAVRWIVHGVLFVALAAGVFGVLPRLGGLTRDAAGLRHGRPAFMGTSRASARWPSPTPRPTSPAPSPSRPAA